MTKYFGPNVTMQIELNPFSFTILCKDKLPNLDSMEIFSDVEWCSLPDILYVEPLREFIGLSFAVDIGQEGFARHLVERSNNSNVRFVPATGLGSLGRYSEFGPCSRLEVFWSMSIEPIKCELASLFDGVWVVNKNGVDHFKGVSVPACYRLFDMDDILFTHELKFPSNLPME